MSNTIPGIPPIDTARVQSEIRKPTGDHARFSETLRDAIGQVEQVQTDAQKQVTDLLQGNGADIHSTLIAVEKADLSFQLMMQVRNKIVQAYQEISRMAF